MSVNRILIISLLWLLPGISTGETYEVDSDADFFILGDITNDTIIAEKNVNVSLSTGDLTRLMALYVVFSALDQGRIHLDEYVEISRAAAQTPGARMFLVDGQRIQIKNLIESVASYGAMDAMIALVEATSESESDFVSDMNRMMRPLGLKESRFVGVSDPNVHKNTSTPKDLYLLSRALIIDFPEYYHVFKTPQQEWNGLIQYNTNKLLGRDQHNDGLAASVRPNEGHVSAISAYRDQRRILLILGQRDSEKKVLIESQRLVNLAFEDYTGLTLFGMNHSLIEATIVDSTKTTLKIGTSTPVGVSVPTAKLDLLNTKVETVQPVVAPIERGDLVGKLKIRIGEEVIKTLDLIALENAPKSGVFSRGWVKIKSFLLKIIE